MSLDNDLPPQEEPQREKRRSCLFVGVAGVVIIALLASSIASLILFIGESMDNPSEPPASISKILKNDTLSQIEEGLADELILSDDFDRLLDPAVGSINRIVFVNDEGQIETVAPDGSEQRVLTDDTQYYEFPAWSPDGSQIAALGRNHSGGGIYLLQDESGNGDSPELYFSTNRRPFYLYWSPDGQQISFLANNPVQGIGLNIIDAEMGEESREIAAGSPLYWNWTADSKQMLIHSGSQADDSRLVLINDTGQDQAPQIPEPGFFQAPGISPSGRFWAYSQLGGDGLSWVTVDDQINGDQSTDRHAGSLALNWSPVSDKLAYISGDDRDIYNYWGPLRLLDAETGETRLLSSNLVLAFFWSPDGEQILTISVPQTNGLDGGVEVRDTKSRHQARVQQAVPPSQRMPHHFMLSVINVENGDGLELAEVTFATSFLSQFLVYFDQYSLSHSLWSPDSEHVVIPIVADGEEQIVVFSAKSGRKHQIGNGSIAFWSKQ